MYSNVKIWLIGTIDELLASTTSHTDILEKNKEEILSIIKDTRNKYQEAQALTSTKIRHLNIEMDDIMMQNTMESDNLIKAVASNQMICGNQKMEDDNMMTMTDSFENSEGIFDNKTGLGLNGKSIPSTSTSSSTSSSCMNDKRSFLDAPITLT